MVSLHRIAVAARAFSLAAILGLAFALGGGFAAQSVVLVGAIALTASVLAASQRRFGMWVTFAEACLVALVIGVTLPGGAVLVPYLATPALIAGLYRGGLGVGAVLCGEVVSLAAISVLVRDPFSAQQGESVLTWIVTGLGLGLLGSFVHSVYLSSTIADETYRDARQLLGQLRVLSSRLTEGLDPVAIADRIIGIAKDELGAVHGAVFVSIRDGGDAPFRYSSHEAVDAFEDSESLVARCRESRTPVNRGTRRALPLATESDVVGVLLVDCQTSPEEDLIERTTKLLGSESLRLDTALLFEDVRAEATSEERQRLAREVHDGIAQDVASLGYLVDGLLDTPTEEGRRTGLAELRAELSRVVAELRLSVFDLRNEALSAEGLGTALAAFARQIGSTSDLTVHLTLDEGTTRLRPDVEGELLRIGQEAMNNARKHSGGSNLWVDCTVHPPYAEVVVRDDGAGLGAPRTDSHGLMIMRERVERIGAELEVTDRDGNGRPGTCLRVLVGAPASPTFESAEDTLSR